MAGEEGAGVGARLGGWPGVASSGVSWRARVTCGPVSFPPAPTQPSWCGWMLHFTHRGRGPFQRFGSGTPFEQQGGTQHLVTHQRCGGGADQHTRGSCPAPPLPANLRTTCRKVASCASAQSAELCVAGGCCALHTTHNMLVEEQLSTTSDGTAACLIEAADVARPVPDQGSAARGTWGRHTAKPRRLTKEQ